MGLEPATLALEALYAAVLFAWVMAVVSVVSKRFYEGLRARGSSHNVAVYYTRKLIHAAAGGLVALTVPYLFATPLIPSTAALVLAVLTYIPHRRGQLMYWFQTPDNIYEVHFCLAWGVVMTIAWFVFRGNFWYGVIPVSFMAFGDAVTGVVRNLVYGRRTKSWLGNLAMLALCVPLGWALGGVPGALAGLVASLVEHFELGPIDDNITVPLVALAVLVLLNSVAWV